MYLQIDNLRMGGYLMIAKIRKSKGGFTLTELLVVVAIVGILVTISIPIFTSQIHKARVATDWANVRAYYAELTYDYQQTEEFDKNKLHEWNWPAEGITEFKISGESVKLKTGQLWVAPAYNNDNAESDDKFIIGYNLLYICNDGHAKHILNLG